MSANPPVKAPNKENSVFLTYRRKDAPGYVARLCDDIISRFGEVVFRDVDGILGGDQWEIGFKRKVTQAKVVLAIIGEHWLQELQSREGETDYVRLELNTARKHDIDVIPVLLNEVRLPQKEALGDLAWLLELQGHTLSDLQKRWPFDSQQLLNIVKAKAQLEEVSTDKGQDQPWWYDKKRWIGVVAVLIIAAIIMGIFSMGGNVNVNGKNGVTAGGDIKVEGDLTIKNGSEQKK